MRPEAFFARHVFAHSRFHLLFFLYLSLSPPRLLPRAADDSVLHMAYILFWLLALVVTVRTIVTYGNEFVDHPRLSSFSVKEKVF